MSSSLRTSNSIREIRKKYQTVEITEKITAEVLPAASRGDMLLMLPWRHFYRRAYLQIKKMVPGGNGIRLRFENPDKAYHVYFVTRGYYKRLMDANRWPHPYTVRIRRKGSYVFIQKDMIAAGGDAQGEAVKTERPAA